MKMRKIIIWAAVIAACSITAQADENMRTKSFSLTEDVVLKDILTEPQQDIYTISPGTGNQASNTVAHRSQVSIWVNHEDNIYAYGDHLVISAKATRDGYLTIIDVGTSGKIRQLFPNRYQTDNYVRKGDIVQIPARHAKFQYTVAGPAGTELIKAFLTDSPNSIYGYTKKHINEDVFPIINSSSQELRKDILITLNNTHQNHWSSYDKVIRIVPSANTSHDNDSPRYVSAMRAEQSLKLNAAQIRDIQRYLRQANFYHGSIDGKIGNGTRSAIRAWQRSVNLPASGYIDSKTFNRIMN